MSSIVELLGTGRLVLLLSAIGTFIALLNLSIVLAERVAYGAYQSRRQRLGRLYAPVIDRALAGDESAMHELKASPSRHRLPIAWILINPLTTNRDPARVARTHEIARALLVPLADRFLRSRSWRKRALALRAIGLSHLTERTTAIVEALDDPHPEVRAAALDAMVDSRDAVALPAFLARMHDDSLQRSRRGAVLLAFGSACEALLLKMAATDAAHRFNYARALLWCGTARSLPVLCQWARDPDVQIRFTALEAFGRIGLDAVAASVTLQALESDEIKVREMAARALRGWVGAGDAASHLSRHLDDAWPVAVEAAHSLKAMGDTGRRQLEAAVSRPGLAATLARQMLWELDAKC